MYDWDTFWIILPCVSVVPTLLLLYLLFKHLAAKRKRELWRAKEAIRQRKRLQAEANRQRKVHQYFDGEFRNRQHAIGQIVCPQCKWTGCWGEGMSYQEFFAYELHVKHKVKIDEMLIRDADNLSNESQYKCPMCKSTNWQKV